MNQTPMQMYAADATALKELCEMDILTDQEFEKMKDSLRSQLRKDLVETGLLDNEVVRP